LLLYFIVDKISLVAYLEGVYWDLDGTIANTELEAHLPAFNNAFKTFVLIGIGILINTSIF